MINEYISHVKHYDSDEVKGKSKAKYKDKYKEKGADQRWLQFLAAMQNELEDQVVHKH